MNKFFAAIKLLLTLRCEHSTHLVSQSLDRNLSPVERWAVRLHYISCWSCRRFGKQLRQIRTVLQQNPNRPQSEEQLSQDALNRIHEAIRKSN